MATKKTTKSSKRNTAKAWFKPVRGSYLPNSGAGWLAYLPFVAYLVFTFVVGWRQTSSAEVAVLFIVPNWVAAAAVMTWVAARES
jgi:hypothetical protein